MFKEEYEYDNEIKKELLCTIENIFSLGCFTILAVLSNHWWIVFFAILFRYNLAITKKESRENEDE